MVNRVSIGDQFEKYEHQVQYLRSYIIRECEYEEFKLNRSNKTKYSLKIKEVRLYFNCDSLAFIIYHLAESDYDKCLNTLNKNLNETKRMKINIFECYNEANSFAEPRMSLFNDGTNNFLCIGKQFGQAIIKPCKHR